MKFAQKLRVGATLLAGLAEGAWCRLFRYGEEAQALR